MQTYQAIAESRKGTIRIVVIKNSAFSDHLLPGFQKLTSFVSGPYIRENI